MAKIAYDVIEVLIAPSIPQTRVIAEVIEVLHTKPSVYPTSITGAGVTQEVVEVLISPSNPQVRMVAEVVEVLMQPIEGLGQCTGGGGPGAAATTGWVTIS